MASNEHPYSPRDSDSSTNTSNHTMIDIPLYGEAKMTRKQAIDEIADVILRSNMKPRTVQYALQLLQKLLPGDHTLPATINELFGAMMSSENDWRLAQYLIKHNQSPSFSPSSSSSPSPMFLPFNSNESSSSSSSDDENELSPYDRLQQCLRPITDISRDFNLNYATSMHDDNIHLFGQRSQLASNSVHPSTVRGSLKRLISETSSRGSNREGDLFYRRIFADFEDDSENETSSYSTTNENKKLSCFEINGCDLLNDSKRRRYY